MGAHEVGIRMNRPEERNLEEEGTAKSGDLNKTLGEVKRETEKKKRRDYKEEGFL